MFKCLGMDMSPFTSGEPFQYLGKMANGAERNIALKHPPKRDDFLFFQTSSWLSGGGRVCLSTSLINVGANALIVITITLILICITVTVIISKVTLNVIPPFNIFSQASSSQQRFAVKLTLLKEIYRGLMSGIFHN